MRNAHKNTASTATHRRRCSWVPLDKPDYVAYHDREWGRPVRDDRKLFEMLILEGAQAGLSWYTILRRREAYRIAFKGFDPTRAARMTDRELERLLTGESGIIRNRLKVFSVRTNAKAFLDIQEERASFFAYIKSFSGDAKALSKDLKKRGMSFVGEEIVRSFLLATGFVNGHEAGCDSI